MGSHVRGLPPVEAEQRIMANAACRYPRDEPSRPADRSDLSSTLPGIPSVFERLIYIASLANTDTEVDRDQEAVRAEHQAVFEDWLAMSLGHKHADLEVCAASQGRSATSMMRHWIQPSHYEDLIPLSAVAPQRELFVIELEVLFLII